MGEKLKHWFFKDQYSVWDLIWLMTASNAVGDSAYIPAAVVLVIWGALLSWSSPPNRHAIHDLKGEEK